VFGNAYACAVSTPTRTSIMTGMNAAHTRITNWTSAVRDTPSDATGGGFWMAEHSGSGDALAGDVLSRPDWNINGISPVPGVPHTQYASSLVQYLKDAGYFTIHVGKAHFGPFGSEGEWPENLGFDINIAGSSIGEPGSYFGENGYGLIRGRRARAVPGLENTTGPTHSSPKPLPSKRRPRSTRLSPPEDLSSYTYPTMPSTIPLRRIRASPLIIKTLRSPKRPAATPR
jgi:arylsulfatase A-like enzyme